MCPVCVRFRMGARMNSVQYQGVMRYGRRLLQPVAAMAQVCARIMRTCVGGLAGFFGGRGGWTPRSSACPFNIPTPPSSSQKTDFTQGETLNPGRVYISSRVDSISDLIRNLGPLSDDSLDAEVRHERKQFDLAERSIRFLNFVGEGARRALEKRVPDREGGHCVTRVVGIAEGLGGQRWHLYQLPCGQVFGFQGQGAQ